MTQEERLFDLIGMLPDDLTAQAEIPKPKRKLPPAARKRWIGIAVAACLAAVFLGWGMTSIPYYARDDANFNTHSLGRPGTAPNWADNVDDAVTLTALPVNDRMAEYQQVTAPTSIPKAQRPQYLGESYRELEDWYLPALTDDLRYLIHAEEDGTHTLWEFSGFRVYDEEELAALAESLENGSVWSTIEWFSTDLNFTPYTYGEVLETIYGVSSAEDLTQLTVSPANMDSTDAGKKLQKQIGTRTIWQREELDALYKALVHMVCYGADNWEQIDLGDSGGEDGLLNSVWVCRYLTLQLADGSTIDTLKYSAAGGQFYEYGGIAYSPLDAEAAGKMNEIFGIETE